MYPDRVQNKCLTFPCKYNYSNIDNPKARMKLSQVMDDMQVQLTITEPPVRIVIYMEKNKFFRTRSQGLHFDFRRSIKHSKKYLYQAGCRSDHSIVVLELKFNPLVSGRGRWKFNSCLLYDTVYIKKN